MALNRLTQIFSSVGQNIDDDMSQFTPLKKLCDNFGIKPSYIIVPFLTIYLLLTIFGIFEHIFVTIFGMIFPAYMSFKAINQNSQQKSKQWLTYWIVFGFVTSFDRILSVLLFFVPAFYTFKILFLLWLFYPRTNGAQVLYEKVLRPQLINLRSISQKYHPH